MVPFRLLACFLSFAALAPAVSAQQLFDAPWRAFQTGTPETGHYTLGLTAADLNGDGLPDAITAQNVFDPGVRVMLNLGSAQGTPATFQDNGTLLPLSKGAWDVVTADLDGDGDVDIAAPNTDTNYTGTTVVVFRNNGNGTFAAGQSHAAGNVPYGITAADLDGDGDVDLVVTNYGYIGQGTTISVLLNNGSATFAAPVSIQVGAAPARVRAGDLDGDGDADLVVSHESTRGTVLFNSGGAAFGAPVVYDYSTSSFGAVGLALLDPDADGDLDVVFAGFYDQGTNDGRLALLRNNGSGTFTTQLVPYGHPYQNIAVELAAADFDGDGRDELVGAQQYESGFVVFRDNNAGSFLPGDMYASVQNVSGEAGAIGVAAADLDGDGDPDVLTTGRLTRLLSAHENVGNGLFPERPIYGRGSSHTVIDLGDVDGDGDLDVVTSHGGVSTSDIAVYRNDGSGAFAQSHRVAGNYAFAKLRELTGDGVLDLLFVSAPSAPPYDFFVAQGIGNGTFAAPVRHVINACGLAHPEAFDLDADGDLDVVNTENAGCAGGSGGNTIRVSLNNGNGTFAPQMIFVAGIWPYNTAAGDFNGDGNVDLATASQGVSAVVFGNGDGTFQQPGLSLPSGELGANILALDLDADGDLDLATLRDYSPNGSAGSESELVILFGNGAGAFTPVAYPQFLTQDFREWLSSGDVDADGDPDILVGGVNDGLVFLNDGAGALTYSGRYGIGTSAFSMHYADVNGDGNGDLLALASLDTPPSGGDYGIVVVEGLGSATGTSFCSGDSSGTACPCGNNGVAGHGCANSLNAAGAQLVANGLASIANDTLVLIGSGMPNSSCLYFQGTGQVAGGAGVVFGDGLRCAGGSILRLGTKSNTGGTSQYPGAGDPPVSVRGQDAAGDVRHYQSWYRNADPTFCTSSTFNLTNGVTLTWAL